MVLNGITLTLAPLISALLGLQVKPPPGNVFGKFIISLMMGLMSVTYFTLRLHVGLLQSEFLTGIGGTRLSILEFLIAAFFLATIMMLAVAVIFDKVSNPQLRTLAATLVALTTYCIAFLAVILPPNLVRPTLP